MAGKFTGFREDGIRNLLLQVEDGMERVGRAVTRACRRHAPVRKKQYRRREKTVSVKFSRIDEQEPLFTPSGRRNLVQAVSLSDKPRPIINRFTGQERSAAPARGRLVPATRFTLRARLASGSRATAASRRSVGRRFGGLGSPTRKGASFRIRLNRGAEGGALRKSIRAEPVTNDGRRKARVVVRATVPYALFVEKGFHHKGGTQVPGQHYMQRGLAEVQQQIPQLLGGGR